MKRFKVQNLAYVIRALIRVTNKVLKKCDMSMHGASILTLISYIYLKQKVY